MKGTTAVITGSTSAIGGALAQWLATAGAHLVLLGRDAHRIDVLGGKIHKTGGQTEAHWLDFEDVGAIDAVCDLIRERHRRIGLLIHCAGIIVPGPVAASDIRQLDRHYVVNLRAPFLITKLLLPSVVPARGQVVFLNSGAGLIAKRHRSQYSASKFALRALADSLREEVEEDGVRVMSVYPGPTAGPLQEELHRTEARPYRGDDLLQPEHIAAQIGAAITLPPPGQITDLVIKSGRSPS